MPSLCPSLKHLVVAWLSVLNIAHHPGPLQISPRQRGPHRAPEPDASNMRGILLFRHIGTDIPARRTNR